MSTSLLQLIPAEEKKLIRKEAMPSFIKPMLAEIAKAPFSDKNWVFERKLDGERCLIFKKGNSVILKSRNNKILNESYPEVVTLIKKLSMPKCIIDSEIVAMKNKITDFSLLQERFGVNYAAKISPTKMHIYCYAFDIMYYDGYLVTHLPWTTRNVILKNLIPFQGIFRYVTHRKDKGAVFLKKACQDKWEGLMAKKNNSPYLSKRSPYWLKLKCGNEQEFVIGGYTQPAGTRTNFGALLLGYYDKGKLLYAGKVGTGFNETILADLGKKLKKLTIKRNPFNNYDLSTKNVLWIKPQLVCQIKFTEWTRTNKLRHPSFLGLRYDKVAKDVKKEVVAL